MRRAIACATLIEQHDSISFRIKEAAVVCGQSGSGAAVEKDYGLPVRIPALLVINVMDFGYFQHPLPVGLDRIVKSFHRWSCFRNHNGQIIALALSEAKMCNVMAGYPEDG